MFESAAILTDVHVPLVETVELLLDVDGVLEAVVEELPSDRRPGGVRTGTSLVDITPDLLGDGGVEPGDDAGVDLKPL